MSPLPTALHDAAAERCIAGCAVETRAGAQLAVERLKPHDFHDPRMADLVFTAARLWPTGDRVAFDDMDGWVDRIADEAGVWRSLAHEVVRERPVMNDGNGYFAGRVKAAAQRRREVATLVERLEELGVEVSA